MLTDVDTHGRATDRAWARRHRRRAFLAPPGSTRVPPEAPPPCRRRTQGRGHHARRPCRRAGPRAAAADVDQVGPEAASGHRSDYPGTGGEFARHVLDRMGLASVGVEETHLGDHYDPEKKVVRLSADHFKGRSLAAVVVAAHEVGHAMQDATGYGPLAARTRLAKQAQRMETVGAVVMLAAPIIMVLAKSPHVLILQVLVGVMILGMTVLMHAVTLPVEFDASFNRALPLLKDGGYRRPAGPGVGPRDPARRGAHLRRRRRAEPARRDALVPRASDLTAQLRSRTAARRYLPCRPLPRRCGLGLAGSGVSRTSSMRQMRSSSCSNCASRARNIGGTPLGGDQHVGRQRLERPARDSLRCRVARELLVACPIVLTRRDQQQVAKALNAAARAPRASRNQPAMGSSRLAAAAECARC